MFTATRCKRNPRSFESASTTSQDEADRNRGRAMRAREEKLGKLTRQRDKAAEKCRSGQQDQCQRAEVLDHEIEAVMAEQI